MHGISEIPNIFGFNCDLLTASIVNGPCLQECTDAKVLKRYLKLLDDDGMKPQMSCEAFFVRLNVMGVECVFFLNFHPEN